MPALSKNEIPEIPQKKAVLNWWMAITLVLQTVSTSSLVRDVLVVMLDSVARENASLHHSEMGKYPDSTWKRQYSVHFADSDFSD